MSDDERRAEIEAVRRALSESAHRPTDYSIEAAAAIKALDRVRDARGDDEAGVVYALRCAVSALGAAAVAFRKLDAGNGYPPHIAADNAGRAEDAAREALRRYDREREAARSLQGEDYRSLTAKIADELRHNDECGSGPLSDDEYMDDAAAILRIVNEHRSPRGEDG